MRSKSRMVASLAQPLLYLFAFGYGFSSVFAAAGGGSYIHFLAPGIIAMSVMFTAVFGGIEVIWDKQFGFLKETMVAPVSRFNIMFGRTLGGATVAFIQGIVVLIITILFGFRPLASGIIPALVFMFLLAFLFTAFGTAIASRLDDMQGFPLVINFIVMPLFFLSGSLFPVTNLPTFFSYIIKVNPLSYAIDGIRGSLIGTHVFAYSTDFLVLLVITLICLVVGGYLFKKIQA
jgi:ABC-2 type transport system permease protein